MQRGVGVLQYFTFFEKKLRKFDHCASLESTLTAASTMVGLYIRCSTWKSVSFWVPNRDGSKKLKVIKYGIIHQFLSQGKPKYQF